MITNSTIIRTQLGRIKQFVKFPRVHVHSHKVEICMNKSFSTYYVSTELRTNQKMVSSKSSTSEEITEIGLLKEPWNGA